MIERHQVQALTNFLWHTVGDLIDVAVNGTMHDPAHGSHRHFGGLIVNGQDAGGLVVFFQRLHVRVDYPLAALHALLDLAVQQDPLAKLIALLKIAMLVIPQQEEKTGFVSDNGFEHPATPAGQKAPLHAGDLTDDRGLIPHLKMANFLDFAPVLITKGNMVEQIFDRLYAQPCQLLGPSRSHALDVLHRVFKRWLERPKRTCRFSLLDKGGWGGYPVKNLP